MNADGLKTSELRRQAVHWFTRMHSGDAGPEEIAACEAWRQAHPDHERMYRSIAFLWEASGQMSRETVRAMLARPDAVVAKRAVMRRRFGLGLAGACALGIAAAIALSAWLPGEAQYRATLQTGQGERNRVTLPDGSTLTLNVNTTLEVALYRGRREVVLREGEAFFDVQSDPRWPFLVQADATEVEVTGTRFNVRHAHEQKRDAVNVSVESGSVAVTSGAWWSRSRQHLRAGQGVSAGPDGMTDGVMEVQVAHLAAWREGKIVFDNASLESVVAEMNRYLPQPLRLDAPHLRDYRVAGVFDVDAPQAMLDALPAIAPVRVLSAGHGPVRIVAR